MDTVDQDGLDRRCYLPFRYRAAPTTPGTAFPPSYRLCYLQTRVPPPIPPRRSVLRTWWRNEQREDVRRADNWLPEHLHYTGSLQLLQVNNLHGYWTWCDLHISCR